MNKLSLHLFGSPHIERAGVNLAVGLPKKAQAILFYLAVTGKTYDREWIASLFWSEVPTSTALKNLRDLLPELRKLLPDSLIVSRQTLALNPSQPYFLDVATFQVALRAEPPQLETALSLYQGEFLADFHIPHAPLFEDWVVIQREHLHELAVQNLDTLVEQKIAQQAWQAGLELTRQLLHLEPWRESAHRQRMLLLAQTGQRLAALEQYTTCRKILADEFGVTPTTQTELLVQQIRANQLAAAPETVTAPARYALPRSLTPFFGREVELARLTALLRDPAYPLVTLMGEGGIGKTRLALAAARQVLPAFPDGVWFVALAGIPGTQDAAAAADSLARAIADLLGFQFHGPTLPTQQLIQRLRAQKLLLVLDNFEHLIAGTEFILTLLEQAEHVAVLVASRERLSAPAEWVMRLQGLPVPEGEDAAAMTASSVQLFAERSARVSPHFVVDETNLGEVLRICRAVEGLPLGIELAAAMTERQTCPAIAQAISLGLAHLTTTHRGLNLRHHSLASVFDYSWQLLTAAEAQTLARCAVFRGGFSVAAAQAITGTSVAHLVALANKSLLRPALNDRFELHELVRQFAGEQLARQESSAVDVAHRHCDYYLGWLQQNQDEIENSQAMLQAIQADLPNIRAAWQWAVQNRRVPALTQGVQPLTLLYRLMGVFREARHRLDEAINLLRQPGEPLDAAAARLLGLLLLEQSFFYEHLAHLTEAAALAEEALGLGQRHNDVHLQAVGHQRLAAIRMSQGDVEASQQLCEQGLALARLAGLPRQEASGLAGLGIIQQMQDRPEQALVYHTQALAVARQHRYRRFEAIVTGNLAVMYRRMGQFAAANTHAEDALRLSRMIGYADGEGMAHLNLADVYYLWRNYETADSHYAAAHTIFQRVGNQRYQSLTLTGWGLSLLRQGELFRARELSQQGHLLAQLAGDVLTEAAALLVLGQVEMEKGEFAAAEQIYQQVQSLISAGQFPAQIMVSVCLAELAWRQNQPEQALAQVQWVLPHLESLPFDPPLTEPEIIHACCERVGAVDKRLEPERG
ncbi:MAG: tetratricopeptide repeat protein [Chloroflexi bacterium]|nr:tetratricopeptide repeat protein [Chloroflexota bacterium]